MGLVQRRIDYMRQRLDNKQIADTLGVGYFVLDQIYAGTIRLEPEEATALRSLYEREVYSRLKDAGLSANQANRFRWYAPERALGIEDDMRVKVMELTMGYVTARAVTDGRDIASFEDIDLYWAEGQAKILEGLANSDKPYEIIEKYGSEIAEID